MHSSRRSFLAAAAAAPMFLASPVSGGGSTPRADRTETLRRLEMGRLTKHDLPTPSLVLDLDRFEANVTKMAEFVKGHGLALRPHGKTHKCPEIARRLVRAGAVGACAAKLSEAEVFADHGVPGLLVTTAVIGARKIERAVRLAANHPDTIFSVDDARNIHDFNDAAAALGADPPVVVNLAIDLLYGRTGIENGAPALELAKHIAMLPHLRLAGLQAYHGGASHTVGFDRRKEVSTASMTHAVETRRLIEQAGIACPLVTGGSTGTYNIDVEIEGVTELQPGSYMFMDIDYNRIGGQTGPVYDDFQNSLFVISTVVSRRDGVAIVDGGYKAFATDRPFGPDLRHPAGVPYAWAGDEHGRLDTSQAGQEIQLGQRLEFVVPHCDPTVNLYDEIYCLREDRVDDVWRIAARGKSQ